MFASTLNIAHELRKFCEKDKYVEFRTCLKDIFGTYTILDNGISMGSVEFDSNNRVHISKPRGTSHGEWRILSRVMYDIGEKAEYEERHAKWKKDSDGGLEPKPPTKEFIYVTYDEQHFYLFPIFKMHGIYGFVKFDTLPLEWSTPQEWLSLEDECIFLVKKKHQGNYRLYDRDIPRTWDDAHTLTASILEAARRERDIPHASLSIKVGCLSFVIAVIVGILTFMEASQAIYKPAIGSMLLDHGISHALTNALLSIPTIFYLIIYITAVLMLSRQALLPYTQRKMKEGLTSYYERYRSADSDKARTYRLLQHRYYLKEEKKKGYLIPVSFTILFYATCLYALISYHNNPLWENAEKARIEQVQKEQREAEQRKLEQQAAERKRLEQQNAETRKKNAERAARKSQSTSQSSTASQHTPPHFYPADALPKTPTDQVKHTRVAVNKTTLTQEQKTNIQRLKAERDKAYEANDKARYAELTGEIARAGDTQTQYNIGTCYEAKNQFLAAIYWYQMSAATGHGLSLQSLAMIYEEREGMRNYALARYYYEKAAEADIAYSHYRLGHYYENGIAGKKDLKKALDHYYVAAAADLSKAKEGYKRLSGKQSGDYLQEDQTVTEVTKPAATPKPTATPKPATKQTSTQGATQQTPSTNSDKPQPQATAKTEAAPAKTTTPVTSTNSTIDYKVDLSKLQFTDRYEPTLQDDSDYYTALRKLDEGDYQGAFTLLEKAAVNGYDKAQNRLGVIYWNGEVTGRNMDRAAYWLRRAAEQRHPQSLTLLGIYHYTRRSNPLCAKLAFQALYEASKYNESSSYYYLAHCYEYGIGTPVNLVNAAMNYKLAIAAGITKAESDLQRVRAKSK